MKITREALDQLNTGFQAAFKGAWEKAPSRYADVAMITKSATAEEAYGWLGRLPRIREWIGDRVINTLSKQGFTITNRLFESTIEVRRVDIEDDKIGIYKPLFDHFGRDVAEFPDRLVFGLFAQGFTSPCYDGQNFFDTDHPVYDEQGGVVRSVSNIQPAPDPANPGPAWYLLDTTRAIRPIIYQERLPFELQRQDGEHDANVFFRDQYLYGTRGRANVGFGLWQLAYASRAPLSVENYGALRAAMTSARGDADAVLGIQPNILLVPSELEGPGRRIINNQLKSAGESNEWVGSAELIVSPWLAT